jgi:hypothetical protein
MSIITIFHNHELKMMNIFLKVFYVFEFGDYKKLCNDFKLIIMRNRKT